MAVTTRKRTKDTSESYGTVPRKKAKEAKDKNWVVVRLAARDQERRKKEGGDLKSGQKKVQCYKLEIVKNGVIGRVRGLFFDKKVKDYNHYRTVGHSGRFEPGTLDRSVSIATVAAYNSFRESLCKHDKSVEILDGDFGENILVDGPPAIASSDGLSVGTRLRLGTALVELTEANNPCYRFNTQLWAPQAKALWGKTAPDGETSKWFKSPECPLNNHIFPGIRGWLAKVIEEGETSAGDKVQLVRGSLKKKGKKR